MPPESAAAEHKRGALILPELSEQSSGTAELPVEVVMSDFAGEEAAEDDRAAVPGPVDHLDGRRGVYFWGDIQVGDPDDAGEGFDLEESGGLAVFAAVYLEDGRLFIFLGPSSISLLEKTKAVGALVVDSAVMRVSLVMWLMTLRETLAGGEM